MKKTNPGPDGVVPDGLCMGRCGADVDRMARSGGQCREPAADALLVRGGRAAVARRRVAFQMGAPRDGAARRHLAHGLRRQRMGYDARAGNLGANGYGDPVYVNVGYAWRGNFRNDPPHVPDAENHVGSYRRTFDVPAGWAGKQVTLSIGSATSNVYVWINGRFVGYSEDSKLAAQFDVTKYLRPGENLVALQIYRWSDGTYLEDQDFWRLSGIARSVEPGGARQGAPRGRAHHDRARRRLPRRRAGRGDADHAAGEIPRADAARRGGCGGGFRNAETPRRRSLRGAWTWPVPRNGRPRSRTSIRSKSPCRTAAG